jgi:hypothetical protein
MKRRKEYFNKVYIYSPSYYQREGPTKRRRKRKKECSKKLGERPIYFALLTTMKHVFKHTDQLSKFVKRLSSNMFSNRCHWFPPQEDRSKKWKYITITWGRVVGATEGHPAIVQRNNCPFVVEYAFIEHRRYALHSTVYNSLVLSVVVRYKHFFFPQS